MDTVQQNTEIMNIVKEYNMAKKLEVYSKGGLIYKYSLSTGYNNLYDQLIDAPLYLFDDDGIAIDKYFALYKKWDLYSYYNAFTGTITVFILNMDNQQPSIDSKEETALTSNTMTVGELRTLLSAKFKDNDKVFILNYSTNVVFNIRGFYRSERGINLIYNAIDEGSTTSHNDVDSSESKRRASSEEDEDIV